MQRKEYMPQMGWNSYCSVDCEPTEEYILKTAELMTEKGLLDAGYRYICIDDGWLMPLRDKNGNIQVRKSLFPHGMKYLTDKLHSMGFSAGIYLGCGSTTWHKDAGTLGHEFEDAKMIAEMGFDYLKYDYYVLPKEGRNIPEEYKTMAKALKSTGRKIMFAICEHGRSKPHLWGKGIGHSFRTGLDIRDIYCQNPDGSGCDEGIIDIMNNVVAPISKYVSKGFYPDPDFLVVGINGRSWMRGGCSYDEYRTQFALWCMTSSPLIIGSDVAMLDDTALQILKNSELIEINGDRLGLAAERIKSDNGYDIWIKKLYRGKTAVAIVNTSECELTVKLSDCNLPEGKLHFIFNMGGMGDADIGNQNEETTVTLNPHGCEVLTVQ